MIVAGKIGDKSKEKSKAWGYSVAASYTNSYRRPKCNWSSWCLYQHYNDTDLYSAVIYIIWAWLAQWLAHQTRTQIDPGSIPVAGKRNLLSKGCWPAPQWRMLSQDVCSHKTRWRLTSSHCPRPRDASCLCAKHRRVHKCIITSPRQKNRQPC